jgi:hypothetical protein
MKQFRSIARFSLSIAGALISFALPRPVAVQAQSTPQAVTTQSYDNLRSGVNPNETILNTSNVQPATFGRLFTRGLDNIGAYGARSQPLYVPGLTIQGTVHNVVFVATTGNYIYAFDADNPLVPTLWTANLTPANGSVTAVLSLGIIGTPVIDPTTNTLLGLSHILTAFAAILLFTAIASAEPRTDEWLDGPSPS